MKKTILGLTVALFYFSASAQHLFVQGEIAQSENKQRQMVDIGTTAGKHSRISVYVESFKTQQFYNTIEKRRNTGGYRKFFLGVRYAYIVPIKHIVDVVPSVGLDARLNGGNTAKTAGMGIYGRVSNMLSARTALGLEKQLSTCGAASHVRLFANAYAQLNPTLNHNKHYRPGAGAGVIITF